MTADEYRSLRSRVGTQEEAARLLGVHPQTVSKRERGTVPVTDEAAIAIRCLAEHTDT